MAPSLTQTTISVAVIVMLLQSASSAAPVFEAETSRQLDSCACGLPQDYPEAYADWEACPLGTDFDPVAACLASSTIYLDNAPVCSDIAACNPDKCVNYERVLFGGGPSQAQEAFTESMISVCVQAHKEMNSTSPMEEYHIDIASYGSMNAKQALECTDSWPLSLTVGDYCVSEDSYRHAVMKVGNVLIDHVPVKKVHWWMDEMIADATEVDNAGVKDLCIQEEESYELGQAAGDLIVQHFPTETSPNNSSSTVLDACCHSACDSILENFKSPLHQSPNGAVSVSFESIAIGCCDIARVLSVECVDTSADDADGVEPTETPTP
mmetsp:Transcript_13306/g.28890  ORF Transcript_13306/g.28890 Transcript_13306/m.28890 type:complete len:323 (-) Transcript_13306:30-998(-)